MCYKKEKYVKEQTLLFDILCMHFGVLFSNERLMKALIEQQTSNCELTLYEFLKFAENICATMRTVNVGMIHVFPKISKEKISQTVSLFLSKDNFNINAIIEGVTFLDIAQQAPELEEVANLLIQHGAIQSNQQVSNLFNKTRLLAQQCLDDAIISDNSSQQNEKIASYIQEACDLYSNNNVLNAPLLEALPLLLARAWDILPSQTAKDFYSCIGKMQGNFSMETLLNITVNSLFQYIVCDYYTS